MTFEFLHWMISLSDLDRIYKVGVKQGCVRLNELKITYKFIVVYNKFQELLVV